MENLTNRYDQLKSENNQIRDEVKQKSHTRDQLTEEIDEFSKAINDHRISAKAESANRLSRIKHQYPSVCCLVARLLAGWICFCAGMVAHSYGRQTKSSFYKLAGLALMVIGIGLIIWGLPYRRARALEEEIERTSQDRKYEATEQQTLASMQSELFELHISISDRQNRQLEILLEEITLLDKMETLGSGGGGGGGTKRPTLKQAHLLSRPSEDSPEGS